jgi:hypothetical protein
MVSVLTIMDIIRRQNMWEKSYSTVVPNIEPNQIWKIWSDISIRHQWDDDTEWAKIEGLFEQGAFFIIKIKNGPKLKMAITECILNKKFTDTYYFPLARLDGIHEMEKRMDGLHITTTIRMTGWLRWFWQKIVAEKIVATLPHQTDLLVQLARESK